jgi:xylono-1,5-lactonase
VASVRLVGNLVCQLGEGLYWDARTQYLWGVDIQGKRLWRWDLVSHSPQVWPLAQRVGWVLPTMQAGKLLLGLQGGFALADRADPTRSEWLHQPFLHNPALRLNDAKADATGAVWAGSLNNDDESKSDGCLYRLGPTGDLAVVDTGYTVANGPAINADSTLMLHTDSGRRTIYAFDLDAPAGKLSNKREWKVFTEEEGYPDGMCFDAQGCVWVAHWGVGCISRFALDGELLRRVALPTSNVSNVCFAGAELDRIFVTTAKAGLSASQLLSQPLAGALFEVAALGATGLPGLPSGIGGK